MKNFVLEKTKYILNNSWFGMLIPAGLHQLLNNPEKPVPVEKQFSSFRSHPAETRNTRKYPSRNRP
jgi:hypothetical protein